jgi:hypothetical protein
MNYENIDRMAGTRLDRRGSLLHVIGRWLAGDWWQLESQCGKYGVWHPWRRHVWEDYCYTKTEAKAEQVRRNWSGE